MTQERVVTAMNGWAMVLVEALALPGLTVWLCFVSFSRAGLESGWGLAAAIVCFLLWLFLLFGFFTLQPNMSAVLLLFGKYVGTCKQEGFRWANPLLIKKKVSLRANNLNGQKLKVNDKMGNPIEIAVVVVWRVKNTAQAMFDVQDYHEYVEVQSESAVRHLATKYPYDTMEDEEQLSLRGSIDEVSKDLQDELAERMAKAGVVIDEARLSHLAYAQEIAEAMLRRQQAEAIISARRRIVDGAVGMVEMALQKLEEHDTIKLDEERKATMVSNLLVVLCGEQAVSPVVNTGTLYT